MRIRWIASTSMVILEFLVAIGAASRADAQDIEYLAWNAQTGSALVETATGRQQVALGHFVPHFGTVIALDDTRVVLRRELSVAERAALAAGGFAVYEAEQLEVLRADVALRAVPAGGNP